VGAIRQRLPDGQWKEIHGFIFIGATAFSKNDMGDSSPWKVRPLADEYSTWGYQESAECRNPALDRVPVQCQVFVSFYQCEKSFDIEDSPLNALDLMVSDCALAGERSPSPVSLGLFNDVSHALQAIGRESPELRPTAESLERQYAIAGAFLHSRRVRASSSPVSSGFSAIQPIEETSSIEAVIESGDVDRLRVLIHPGGDVNRPVTGFGIVNGTVLHLAVKKGNLGLVRWLLKNGADPTKRDSAGLLPLDYAADIENEQLRAMMARVLR
jgi:hypothetical protein